MEMLIKCGLPGRIDLWPLYAPVYIPATKLLADSAPWINKDITNLKAIRARTLSFRGQKDQIDHHKKSEIMW